MTLDGKPLRYLIGGNDGYPGRSEEVVEFSYDAERKPLQGVGIKYGNLFDEKNEGDYGPYLPDDDVSGAYDEGRIDPSGPGWERNIDDQITRARAAGFGILELDNADSYDMADVLRAVEQVHAAGLSTVAKNPMVCRGDRVAYVGHAAIVGAIVERDCGAPLAMDRLRANAGKPTLPVWFVAFGAGRAWADGVAEQITTNDLRNMGVSYSSQGEYRNSQDILRPVPPDAVPAPPESCSVTITIAAPPGVKVNIVRI